MTMEKKIANEVHQLYSKFAITNPDEIDIEAIAYSQKAIIKYTSLSGCEASIVGMNDKAIITVNSQSPNERQRFSIGHELGHWFKDRGKMGALCSKSDMSESKTNISHREKLANVYSSELLIPSYLLKPLCLDMPLNFHTIRELKSIFNTSLLATALKTVKSNLHTGFLAKYDSKGKRKWFCTSKGLPYDFMPPRNLPSDSLASSIMKSEKEEYCSTLDGDVWCKTDLADQSEVHEHSFHYHNGDILVLVWWEDESPILSHLKLKEGY